jgi:ubiquinone/menaquinone biosynthesis C-methylase UbiE
VPPGRVRQGHHGVALLSIKTVSIVDKPLSIEETPREDELICKVHAAYARRQLNVPSGRYSRFIARELCGLHEREFAIMTLLQQVGISSLKGKRILDVGCGSGSSLRLLLEYGAQPEHLFGIDLLADRIKQARNLNSAITFFHANATSIPFADETLDFVIQFTTFSSVLEARSRICLAGEIQRVLAPSGKLLWYDLAFDNPRNPDVKGLAPSQVRKLFPGFRISGRRITLAPPLGRIIAKISYPLYHLVAQVRPLCTHYVCVIEKLQG